MRKAMKEGRHVNMAPRGYRNVRDENNNPTIEPGKDAPIIKWAFEEMQRGVLMLWIFGGWQNKKD
jgi:site-specific DNA recombinase